MAVNDPVRIQTISPHLLSKDSSSNASAVDCLYDLPALTNSGSTSPADIDDTHFMDPGLDRNFQYKELHKELDRLRDMPESVSDDLSLPHEDVVFSQYLRSQSPSFSVLSSDHIDGNMHSPNINALDMPPVAEEDRLCIDLTDDHIAQSVTTLIKAKKPRLTLRVRQPQPKPKILLRMSQPKQPATRKCRRFKPSGKNRKRLRT